MKRKTKHARRERDFDYMTWVKQQRCLLEHEGDCSGVIEADHAGERAGFRRADDRTCISLCSHHHRQRHAAQGIFYSMTKEERREWRREAIRLTQERWEAPESMIPF